MPIRIATGDGQQHAAAISQRMAMLGFDITQTLLGQYPGRFMATSACAAFDPLDHMIFMGLTKAVSDTLP
jgi:hypothetical protein